MSGSVTNQKIELRIGKKIINQLVVTYAGGNHNKPFMIMGSSGLLEISIQDGPAARQLRVVPGQTVTLQVE